MYIAAIVLYFEQFERPSKLYGFPLREAVIMPSSLPILRYIGESLLNERSK